eukprot:scaffold9450_cov88-Phaeocystis_antarctica.AAC.3
MRRVGLGRRVLRRRRPRVGCCRRRARHEGRHESGRRGHLRAAGGRRRRRRRRGGGTLEGLPLALALVSDPRGLLCGGGELEHDRGVECRALREAALELERLLRAATERGQAVISSSPERGQVGLSGLEARGVAACRLEGARLLGEALQQLGATDLALRSIALHGLERRQQLHHRLLERAGKLPQQQPLAELHRQLPLLLLLRCVRGRERGRAVGLEAVQVVEKLAQRGHARLGLEGRAVQPPRHVGRGAQPRLALRQPRATRAQRARRGHASRGELLGVEGFVLLHERCVALVLCRQQRVRHAARAGGVGLEGVALAARRAQRREPARGARLLDLVDEALRQALVIAARVEHLGQGEPPQHGLRIRGGAACGGREGEQPVVHLRVVLRDPQPERRGEQTLEGRNMRRGGRRRGRRLDEALGLDECERGGRRHVVIIDGAVLVRRVLRHRLQPRVAVHHRLLLSTVQRRHRHALRRRRRRRRALQSRHLRAVLVVGHVLPGDVLLSQGLHRVLVALGAAEPALVALGEEAALLVEVRAHLGLLEHLERSREHRSRARGELGGDAVLEPLADRLVVEDALRLRQHQVPERHEHVERHVGLDRRVHAVEVGRRLLEVEDRLLQPTKLRPLLPRARGEEALRGGDVEADARPLEVEVGLLALDLGLPRVAPPELLAELGAATLQE